MENKIPSSIPVSTFNKKKQKYFIPMLCSLGFFLGCAIIIPLAISISHFHSLGADQLEVLAETFKFVFPRVLGILIGASMAATSLLVTIFGLGVEVPAKSVEEDVAVGLREDKTPIEALSQQQQLYGATASVIPQSQPPLPDPLEGVVKPVYLPADYKEYLGF